MKAATAARTSLIVVAGVDVTDIMNAWERAAVPVKSLFPWLHRLKIFRVHLR